MAKRPETSARIRIYVLNLAWIALPCVAVPTPGGAESTFNGSPSGDDLPESSGAVRCPDCNPEGKMPCPTCAGKGELAKTCNLCRGTGRKPCPLCIKADRTDGAQAPGRLICDYCGGRGAMASKPCPRCAGLQTLQCTHCGGKGSLTCRKTVLDKICPACRFVGKVPCTTCDGTMIVTPALIAARGALAARKHEPASVVTSTHSSAQMSEKSSEGETEEASESFTELEARFNSVKGAHEKHLDVFAEDPRPKLDLSSGDAAKLLKLLPRAPRGDDSASGRLATWSERALRLRSRWSELRALFDDEHQVFLQLQRLFKEREARLNDAPRGRRDAVEVEVHRQIGIVLRTVERRSLRLSDESPDWLGRELADLERDWPKIKLDGDTAAEEIAKNEKKEAERAAAARAAERVSREKEAAARTEALRAKMASARRGVKSAALPGPAAQGTPALVSTEVQSRTPTAQYPPSSKRGGKTHSSPGGAEPFHTGSLFWGILGAALASLAFCLVNRARRTAANEEAPAAVS